MLYPDLKLPPDLQAAYETAAKCAGDVNALRSLLERPPSAGASNPIAQILETWDPTRDREALSPVLNKLAATRETPARFGRVVASTAHEAAYTLKGNVLNLIRTVAHGAKAQKTAAEAQRQHRRPPLDLSFDFTGNEIAEFLGKICEAFTDFQFPECNELMAAIRMEAQKADRARTANDPAQNGTVTRTPNGPAQNGTFTPQFPNLDDIERSTLGHLVSVLESGSAFIDVKDLQAFLDTLGAGTRRVAITQYFVSLGLLEWHKNPPYPETTGDLTPNNPDTHRVIYWNRHFIEGLYIQGEAVKLWRSLEQKPKGGGGNATPAGEQEQEPQGATPANDTATAGEQVQPTKGRRKGGRRPLEQSNPIKFQVYERIQREHNPNEDYAEVVKRLKADANFVEQVKQVRLKLDTALVKSALDLFAYRRRNASENRETGTA